MFGPENVDRAKALIANLARKGKAYAQGITELELKVQEATNEDKWGPHGSAMLEIAHAAEDPNNVPLIMGVIYGRFKDRNLEWRLCYKALLLSEFLIKKGPMSIVDEMVRDIGQFKVLQSFIFTDADKRDQGINVRQRASEIVNLLSSRDRIMAERQKARQTAEKYRGLSSSDVARGRLGYSSHSSSSYSSSGLGSNGGYGGSENRSYSSAMQKGEGTHAKASLAVAEEDPVEATRRRIEQLRSSGAAMSPAADKAGSQLFSDHFTPVSGSINMDASTNLFPEQQSRAGPKKLSEVKINPAIAAAFSNMGIKPGLSKPASSASIAASSGAPPSALDLLGDDFQPEPASAASAPVPLYTSAPHEANPGSLLGSLDELANPVPPTMAATQSAGNADELDWGELAGPAPPASVTEAATLAQPADLSDPFSALSFDKPATTAPQPALESDFAPFMAAPSSVAQPVDLFAVQPKPPMHQSLCGSGVMPGSVGPVKGGSMSSVQAAINAVPPQTDRDPFADLLG